MKIDYISSLEIVFFLKSKFIFLTMPLEFVKSNKGRDLLLVDGFTFRFEKGIKEKKHLKCTEYPKFKCHAQCHTYNQDIVKVSFT